MSILVIDLGGTSVKAATYAEGTLTPLATAPTPATLTELYAQLAGFQNAAPTPVSGVAISAPGVVDQRTGYIGGASAIPYIHGFNIQTALTQALNVPVAIENDANCAALAEVATGSAQGQGSVVFIVLGTGVGGAIVIDGKIYPGAHLWGGEFGLMLSDAGQTVSETGTIVNAAARFNAAHPAQPALTGEALYARYVAGDEAARPAVEQMLTTLAKTIYDLQYSLDPDSFVIGGGISANTDFIARLREATEAVRQTVPIASIKPQILAAKYHNEANLRGALANFQQRYPVQA